eukprot:g3679.t1
MTIEVCKILVKIVESLPSATLEEYRGLLYAHSGVLVSKGTVSDYVNKHLKLTRKRINREKMHKFSPANINYYYHYVHVFKQLDTRRFIYVDQSGFDNLNCYQKHGRSQKGSRCMAEGPNSKGAHHSLTAFMSSDITRPPMFSCISTEHGCFEAYVAFVDEALKCGFLQAGDIIVCDNWSGFVGIDTGAQLMLALQRFGIATLPLPCYSPELNPIEKIWRKIKDRLRRANFRPNNGFELRQKVIQLCNEITHHDLQAEIAIVVKYIHQFYTV